MTPKLKRKRENTTASRLTEKKEIEKDYAANPDKYEFREISNPVVPCAKLKFIFIKKPSGEFEKSKSFLYCGHSSCQNKDLHERVSFKKYRNMKPHQDRVNRETAPKS